jgi:4'-phosphopantetheinyl transferase EntD
MGILDRLFAPDVEVRSAPIGASWDDLTEQEDAVVARAVDSRRREFATGRTLARDGLRALGLVDPERLQLLPDADRVPIWPPGFVGSITHKRELCAVAVARSEAYRGLGLDIEPARPVRPEFQTRICTEQERSELQNLSRKEQGLRCRVVFSVKEAVYKAFYPSLRERWSFQDVAVEIDPTAHRFLAEVPRSTGVARVEGSVVLRAGWIVAAIALPSEADGSALPVAPLRESASAPTPAFRPPRG